MNYLKKNQTFEPKSGYPIDTLAIMLPWGHKKKSRSHLGIQEIHKFRALHRRGVDRPFKS